MVVSSVDNERLLLGNRSMRQLALSKGAYHRNMGDHPRPALAQHGMLGATRFASLARWLLHYERLSTSIFDVLLGPLPVIGAVDGRHRPFDHRVATSDHCLHVTKEFMAPATIRSWTLPPERRGESSISTLMGADALI
jgi:hypothetical protein